MTSYYDEPPLQWWDWDNDNDGDWDDDDNDEEGATPEPESGTESGREPHRDDAGSGGERDEEPPRRPLGD